jgi:hypothetical protein
MNPSWTWWATLTLSMASVLLAETQFMEDFAANPQLHGWKVFGDTNRFHWDAEQQGLEVNWDSSFPNSYFYWPLPTVLDKQENFRFSFDLRLEAVTPGTTTNKPYAFQIALGFINLDNATQSSFRRGTGSASPNLVEIDYYPDTGYGATLWPMFIATNGVFNYNSDADYALIELPLHTPLQFEVTYSAASHTLTTVLTQDGQAASDINPVALNKRFTDFRVSAFSINCYSDEGAGGSVRAQGFIDNLVIVVPDPPVSGLRERSSQGRWQVEFTGRQNWNYALEGSENLRSWEEIVRTNNPGAGQVILPDNQTSFTRRFHRVRAEKP